MREAAKHIQHYLPLFGILFIGGGGILLFSYDKLFQAGCVVATAVGYFVWGIVHHFLHRDLHLSVVVEYLAIASLGVVIVFSILFRA